MECAVAFFLCAVASSRHHERTQVIISGRGAQLVAFQVRVHMIRVSHGADIVLYNHLVVCMN